MWPIWLIIVIAVVGAAILTCTGILLAITLERRRHRQILRAHGLTRGLSKYHRPKLSACEQNYSHVTHPTTPLRRSVQLPFGIISIGADSAGEDEEKQLTTAADSVEDYIEVLRPRSKRGILRPFSGHPLYIPKTRRQGKLRKAVPLDRIHKSPLSAITEFSDPSTGVSPVTPEFPAEPTTIATDEKAKSQPENHPSTQWPLSNISTRCSDILPTEITSIAARESVLMRKGVSKHRQATGPPSATVPRSVSAGSMASLAPDEPLPPLPTIQAPRHLKTRASTTSLDTVGSSVLGVFMSSLANNGTEPSASKPELNLQPATLGLGRDREFSAPRLQAPPVKQKIHGLCVGQPSIRSLHPTVDVDELSPSSTTNVSHAPPFPTIIVPDESFKVIDASGWDLPPLKVGKTRLPSSRPNRHSMIEHSRIADYRAVSDSATSILGTDGDVFSVPEAPKRPNSVATGNPLRWDRQGSFATKRHSLSSLDGPRRGHRRQNCVRITNLPCLDLRANGAMRLPELKEEQQQLAYASTFEADESVHGFEIKQPRPTFKMGQSETSTKSSTTPIPSPFRNPPILTPTPRPARKQYIQRPDSAVSGTPRPDSEVFDFSHIATQVPKRCNISPCQWPLSPCSRPNVLLRETPPSSQASARIPFESPTLPSPALNSASLYPRKSLVKGPRGPRNSSHSSNAPSASPLQNKIGPSYRVTKARDSSGPGDFAVRKSVMILRGMDSERSLLEHRRTKTSNPTVAEYESPDIIAMPSPLMNKRVMGLRSTSCTPSATSTPRSAPLDRQRASRGSSPLARSGSNSNRQPQSRATAARMSLNSDHLELPPPVMCVSPSVMSVGDGSIWEDVSVRGDSPEPEIHVAPLALRPRTDHNQQQRYPLTSTSQARGGGEDLFNTQGNGQFLGPHAPFVGADTENASRLVQQLERAVSGEQWNQKDIVHPSDDPYVNVAPMRYDARGQRDLDIFQQLPNHNRKEIGLGLRLGNSTMRST
ncbi:uncharacterized protein Z520_05116 [Fonsecaea multimorphosa CBS 102226]|uniref:Uncharacterized protein n=1 Tax=Fonsecaea multimorphosa CBS 102226 TaxID=1442371 RepID=A0A0D2HCB9_9EURO|nr:uncharacterized protein Z520_05116 [Fonsecaea multimorphosa CBS 102226]KIX99540.1 hypothetical protein Z520_05116 [Fonsecaea multimorphosa CBS 102226]OAL25532.1 hypothetical protein AYO22_04851 [Fonsecaea multimorphosa]